MRWDLVERDGDDWAGYRGALRETLAQYRLEAFGVDVWAVEGLNHPHPRMKLVNVRGLLDTARVIGWLDVWLAPSRTVLEVPPGRHGSGPLAAYPAELVGPRERSGSGKMRHVRSAFDVAHAAVGMIAAAP